MWITTKKTEEGAYDFLRPEKVEKIEYVDGGWGQGTGPTLRFYIDGKKYTSGDKLGCYVGYGATVIKEESKTGKLYNCDDSIIIAAVARHFFTYQYGDVKKLRELKRGDLLPLLSRKVSREYLLWHQIPHPGKCLHLNKKYLEYIDFQPTEDEFVKDLKSELITNPLRIATFMKKASAFKSVKIKMMDPSGMCEFVKTVEKLKQSDRDKAIKAFNRYVEGRFPLKSAIQNCEKCGMSLLLKFDHDDTLEFLIQNGANLNAIVCEQYVEPNLPILAVLAYRMQIDKMRFLLEHGADPNQGVDGGKRPLDLAFFMQRGYEPAKLLLQFGADPKLCKNQDMARKAMEIIKEAK